MQYHGCRSNIKDRSKVTELEDKFDLLVDTNDVILERVVSASRPHEQLTDRKCRHHNARGNSSMMENGNKCSQA